MMHYLFAMTLMLCCTINIIRRHLQTCTQQKGISLYFGGSPTSQSMSMSKVTQTLASAGEYVVQTLRHPTRRNIIYVMAIVWINIINLYVFYHRHETLAELTNSINEVAPLNNYKDHAIPRKMIEDILFKMWAKKGNIQIDERHLDAHSRVYDEFFSKHEYGSIVDLSYIDRCDAYFRTLYAQLSLWSLKEEEVKDDATMRDYTLHLRVFTRCYVDREDAWFFRAQTKFIQKQKLALDVLAIPFKKTEAEINLGQSTFDSCLDLHLKMFPWMAGSFATHERHNGKIVRTPPVMKEYVDARVVAAKQPQGKASQVPVHLILTNNQRCWLSEFKSKLNGRGIVIPFDEEIDVDSTVNLIHLLRVHGNLYPIQIVYYGALKDETRKKLVDAARRPFTDFPSSFSQVGKLLAKLVFDSKTNGFISQELWLVDALSMVAAHFQDHLASVPIIAWAGFVNSFEEYVLMQPQAVPMQNPLYFFDLPQYQKTGAYFYRAPAWHTRSKDDSKYFNKMTPSLIDATMFNIDVIGSKTLDIGFFDTLADIQDLRLMVVDRNRHFLLVLMHLQLAMNVPEKFRGTDAREMWLSFVINGDFDFHFNDVMAAAVGKRTDPEKHLKTEKQPHDLVEICSAQVGHLDPKSSKLAWMGGGFQGCSAKTDFNKEFTATKWPWRHISSEDDLRQFYSNRVTVEEAVIPPYKDTGSLQLKNDDGEPELPWRNFDQCNAGFFCGYSRIGGNHKGKDTTMRGQVVHFDAKEIELYNFYGDVWVGSD